MIDDTAEVSQDLGVAGMPDATWRRAYLLMGSVVIASILRSSADARP